MKNLANCKPTEFIKQTNKIKKSVEKWLTVTDIINIRKNMPEFENIDPDMDKEEAKKKLRENIEKRNSQAMKNFSRILDAVLEDHPDETLEVLALVCFVEPQDVDNHTMDEYMTSISEMLGSEAVIGFFTSLARWGVLNISK